MFRWSRNAAALTVAGLLLACFLPACSGSSTPPPPAASPSVSSASPSVQPSQSVSSQPVASQAESSPAPSPPVGTIPSFTVEAPSPAPSPPSNTPSAPALTMGSVPGSTTEGPQFFEDAKDPQAVLEDRQVARLLAEKYPNLKVITVARLPVGETTLYEFVASGVGGKPVLGYTDGSVGFVFIGGELVTGQDGQMVNLTKKRAQAAGQRVLTNLPVENTIKLVFGKGERTLKMFSDPDCPYCRKLEREMADNADRINATVYLYPYPLSGIHPAADARARYLLCTENPSKSWHDWALSASTEETSWNAFSQSHPSQPSCAASTAVDSALVLGRSLGLAQTPVLVFDDASVLADAPDAETLIRLLDAKPR